MQRDGGARWQDLADANPENRVAGNVDDLVKHTIYLTLLSLLGEREPWRSAAVVRECHAGRGVYLVARDDTRHAAIRRLGDTRLGRAQRRALAAVSADPATAYAGSALLCALSLGSVGYEAYEWDPATRAILRAVMAAAKLSHARVAGDRGEARFDGESHIADHLSEWGETDVLLLDPFGVWDRDKHEIRRERYVRIVDALARHPAPPVWLLYFTWRNPEGRRSARQGSYLDLRARIASPLIEAAWESDVPCAMWIAVPERLAASALIAFEAATRELDAAVGLPEIAWRLIEPGRAASRHRAPTAPTR